MTLDDAVALSFAFLSDLPRAGLTDRLRADDPTSARTRALAPAAGAMPCARLPQPRASTRSRGTSRVSRRAADADAICPPALWYRGRLDALNAPAVAIVGSRAASAVAIETATRIATDLASRGVTVVSGLARGVDSAAHRGALQTGRTIAVLGSGVDHIYPRRTRAARRADCGAMASSSASIRPATPPLPFHFPMRNRLISGLSRAVVVIEATEKSGSLITAACALEQGRDVMAVPGNVLSGRNRGAHALIRDGAKIVECADDIVEELGWAGGRGPVTAQRQ